MMDHSSSAMIDLGCSTNQGPLYRSAFSDPDVNYEGRGPKRQRLSVYHDSDGQLTSSSSRRIQCEAEEEEVEDPVESIDLTEVEGQSALENALSKQREDAVKAQQLKADEDDSSRSALMSYKCPVCMDTPVDATTTVCGHLFCHKCIIDTLRFSERQRLSSSGKAHGTCPVCRKQISRNDTSGPKRSLVPIQLKLMTRRRGEISEGAT